MPYNAAATPSPDDLPVLAKALDDNLRTVHIRLDQFKTDPTITRDDAQRAVGYFAVVVAQNVQFTTLIKGWLRLKRVPARRIAEAKRLIGVMAKINRVAAKISARASVLAVSGPERAPLN